MIPGTLTVTTIRRTKLETKDAHGNDQYTEARSDLPGCALQPAGAGNQSSSTEYLDAGDRIVSRWRLFTPPGADLSGIDVVEISGVRYEVDGEPAEWGDLNGSAHHEEITLSRVTG